MKPINLRPHEARALAERGEVLVVRPMPVQPSLWIDPQANDSRGQWWHPVGGLDASRWPCPVAKGDRAWGREACIVDANVGLTPSKPSHHLVNVEFPATGCRRLYETSADIPLKWVIDGPATLSPSKMPKWAGRFPSLVVESRRFCRLSGLTADDLRLHGFDQSACAGMARARRVNPSIPFFYAFGVLGPAWNRDNPRHPAAGDPWAWAALLRREAPAP